ncbi:MAG: aldehyde dehydrogenase family protein, partial [Chlorobiaceae bacterium]
MIITINPATEEPIAEYQAMTPLKIEGILQASRRDALSWKKVSLEDRSVLMRALAELMRQQKERHAALITLEMGKPLAQAVAEVVKSAWVCDYYADHAEEFLMQEESQLDGGVRGLVTFEPIGLVLGIMPWNFPFWQVFRF